MNKDADYMNRIGDKVKAELPDGYGFVVFALPLNAPMATMRYCSNCRREDVINALIEWLDKGGRKENWMKHL